MVNRDARALFVRGKIHGGVRALCSSIIAHCATIVTAAVPLVSKAVLALPRHTISYILSLFMSRLDNPLNKPFQNNKSLTDKTLTRF